MIFEPQLKFGRFYQKLPYPIPSCLIEGDKVKGEVVMTLVYDPPLDPRAGAEYCRINVDASLGTWHVDDNGKPHHRIQVPQQPHTKEFQKLYERHQIEHGFKWSPVKVYRRRIPRGIHGTAWDLQLKVLARAGFQPQEPQKVSLIVTWRDPNRREATRDKVYNQTLDVMRRNGWITQDLQVKDRIRLRT